MDSEREEAWASAVAKLRRGEEVPRQEHYALLRKGMFEELNKADAEQEARCVVRYLLSAEDLTPIPWRGTTEADNWFYLGEDWGEERQAEKLRNMIAASECDPDYWNAVNLIAARHHEED